jgi:hypothetical protein
MRYVLFVLVAVVSGCDQPSSAQPTGREPAGVRERGMANCPTAVDGAKTTMHTVRGGIALEITSLDVHARARIRELATLHASLSAPSGAPHTGRHGGPGTTGFCPVVHLGTTVSADEIPAGARVTIVAADPSDEVAVDDLRALVTSRLTTASR